MGNQFLKLREGDEEGKRGRRGWKSPYWMPCFLGEDETRLLRVNGYGVEDLVNF